MPAKPDPELERLGREAHSLTCDLLAILEGEQLPIGLAALVAALRDVAEQTEDPPVRALVVRDLRELADVLEAVDAPKH